MKTVHDELLGVEDFMFNLFPRSALWGVRAKRFNTTIQFLLLSFCEFKAPIVFNNAIPQAQFVP
jgi:hypothetical protein